jgi:hypothetical protein
MLLYWAWFDGWIGYHYDPGFGILYLSLLPTLILAIFIAPKKVEIVQKEQML